MPPIRARSTPGNPAERTGAKFPSGVAFHDPAAPTDSLLEYESYDLLTLSLRDAVGNITSFAERNADDSLDRARAGID